MLSHLYSGNFKLSVHPTSLTPAVSPLTCVFNISLSAFSSTETHSYRSSLTKRSSFNLTHLHLELFLRLHNKTFWTTLVSLPQVTWSCFVLMLHLSPAACTSQKPWVSLSSLILLTLSVFKPFCPFKANPSLIVFCHLRSCRVGPKFITDVYGSAQSQFGHLYWELGVVSSLATSETSSSGKRW